MTPEEIAKIIEETIMETSKDLEEVNQVIAKVARLTVLVCKEMQEMELSIGKSQARSIDDHHLVDSIMARLLE